MTVLVTAASKHGATIEIAERIARELEQRGLLVEVKALRDVDDLGAYEAVVLGSAIYFGTWLKEARSFVDGHAAELRDRPTGLFASGSIVGHPPPADDPNALRPHLAETLVETTGAREHKLFAGRLAPAELGVLERAAVRAAHGAVGDHREWEAVDEWSASIAAALSDPERSRPSSA